jgi:hypothetical protein
MNQRVLFFSRGKGRGHAIPDAAIAADVIARNPSVDVTFASHSAGLRHCGSWAAASSISDFPRTIRSGTPSLA